MPSKSGEGSRSKFHAPAEQDMGDGVLTPPFYEPGLSVVHHKAGLRDFRFLDDQAFLRLEAAGGIELSPIHRRGINEAVAHAYVFHPQDQRVNAEAAKCLETVARLGEEFAKAIMALRERHPGLDCDLATIAQADQQDEPWLWVDPRPTKLARNDGSSHAAGAAAEIALGAMRKAKLVRWQSGHYGPGARKKKQADRLICIVANTFRDCDRVPSIGGDRSGPFARFLKALWDEMPDGKAACIAASSEAFVERAAEMLRALAALRHSSRQI